MNSRTLIVLAIVTALVLLVAMLAYSRRAIPGAGEDSDLLFPGLSDRVNEVAAIVVEGGEETLLIERDGEEWGLVGKSGYPVQFETVKGLIMTLAELEVVEPKTSKPEFYDRLGVADPAEGGDARRATLRDAEGSTLASIVVGDRAEGAAPRRYVRRAGEAQSWLVDGELDVKDDAMAWIKREIVLFPRDRVQSVSIMHPDGEELRISRAARDEQTFAVEDVPAGFELRSAGAAGGIGAAASFLRKEDVAVDGELACDDPGDTVTEFRTFDGLVATAWTCLVGDDVWIRFAADVEPPAGEEAAQSVIEEAGRINELDGWRFRINASQAANLRKRMMELTQPAEPAPETEPDPGSEVAPADAPESGGLTPSWLEGEPAPRSAPPG